MSVRAAIVGPTGYSGLHLAKLLLRHPQVELSYLASRREQPPDLLVYLRASVPTLVSHIQARGREFESSIRLDYLERLNELYEDWIDRYPYPKMVVETDNLDFVNEDEDRYEILSRIENRLFGLFPVEG